jgi:hypothetical protein
MTPEDQMRIPLPKPDKADRAGHRHKHYRTLGASHRHEYRWILEQTINIGARGRWRVICVFNILC